ncbi:MAG: sortase [Microgenomates group bacterium]
MAPIGIIYQAGGIDQKRNYHQTNYHRILRILGGGLIGFVVITLSFNLYFVIRDEASFKLDGPYKIGFRDLLATQAIDLGLDPYFSLYVPKIKARASVIPNVDAGKYSAYSTALKKGVAHAAGTNFPGQGKLVYLFSHSTDSAFNFARYNAVFFLLRKVEKGDRILVYFLNKEYKYVVTEKVVVDATDNSWMIDKNEGEYLVLQTCDPPGTSLRRLVVVARPVN